MGGADRGFFGGAFYGAALLIAHALAGTHAKVSLGSFPPLLAVVTAIIGMFLAAAGAAWPACSESETVASSPRSEAGVGNQRGWLRTLRILPLGSRTKKRRTPQGSSVRGWTIS